MPAAATRPSIDDGRFEVELAAEGADIGAARSRFDTWLVEAGADGSDHHDWLIVFSEMLTNAIQHGTPGQVHVRAAIVGPDLQLTVTNPAPPGVVPDPAEWQLPPPLAVEGRGLGIVGRLADAVRAHHDGGRIHISVTRRLRGSA